MNTSLQQDQKGIVRLLSLIAPVVWDVALPRPYSFSFKPEPSPSINTEALSLMDNDCR